MNEELRQGTRLPGRRRQNGARTSSGLRWYAVATTALLAWVVVCAPPQLRAQSQTTASRIGDLQVGGGFVFARSGYNFTPIHLVGFGAYATFDPRNHWGGEIDFRNVKGTKDSTIYERTYQIGPRVFLHHGRLAPYGKFLIGRGVYNFTNSVANVAYNMYTYGGGVDVRATRSINVRGDYEYQNWVGFPLGTLHSSVFTLGVAYHWHE
jgi:hypothetical protein